MCDQKHERYGCHSKSKSVLPTRVLDVGDGTYSDVIRLYCSQKDEQGDYVALSHCWGKLTDEQKAMFCTVKENIDDRVRGFETSKLPKTFRDAIRVTRELGQRYLWIDSLCIIQNDAQDWRREANTMEIVYSMAYFTIAATSAHDSTQGFLMPRPQREFVKIEKPPPPPPPPRPARTRYDHLPPIRDFDWRPEYKAYTTTGNGIWTEMNADLAPPEVEQFPLYICEHIDDFTGDVEKSILNSRGWVFQERALSRRILHFSAAQTYWECGVGVHCETLTLMYKYVPLEFNLEMASSSSQPIIFLRFTFLILVSAMLSYLGVDLSNLPSAVPTAISLVTLNSRHLLNNAPMVKISTSLSPYSRNTCSVPSHNQPTEPSPSLA